MKGLLTLFSMDVIGVVKKEDPRRFYTYALMDPKDEPYAVFRYRCRKFGLCLMPLLFHTSLTSKQTRTTCALPGPWVLS